MHVIQVQVTLKYSESHRTTSSAVDRSDNVTVVPEGFFNTIFRLKQAFSVDITVIVV